MTQLSSPRLVLASRSPRRQELLRAAGYEFTVDPADVDEDRYPPRTLPADLALMLAKSKAAAVAAHHPEDVVLAADTVVAFGDEIVGKADDVLHAREILRLLSGSTHIVITGIAIVCESRGIKKSTRVLSAVRMRQLTEIDIEHYLQTDRWRGKAGSYGIQDKDPIVTCIGGSPTNVVGLPMTATKDLLEEAGIMPKRADGSGEYEIL